MGVLLNYPLFHADDGNGTPLVGGKLYCYVAGTTSAKNTYTTRAQTTANSNPVTLDTRGDAVVYGSGLYKLVLKDASLVTVWTQDNVEMGTASGTNTFWVDPSETNQSVAGNGSSLKDILDSVGTTEKATVIFSHNGTGNTTVYTFSTSYDLTAYTNISFLFENGAVATVSNTKTLTLPAPANVIAAPTQSIFGATGTVAFAADTGVRFAYWFNAGSTSGTKIETTSVGIMSHTQTHTTSDGATTGTVRTMMFQDDDMADDATLALPTAVQGIAIANAYGNSVHAVGMWSVLSDGTVLLIAGTQYDDADTDGNLCLYDSGSGATLKQRLGAAAKVRLLFYYY